MAAPTHHRTGGSCAATLGPFVAQPGALDSYTGSAMGFASTPPQTLPLSGPIPVLRVGVGEEEALGKRHVLWTNLPPPIMAWLTRNAARSGQAMVTGSGQGHPPLCTASPRLRLQCCGKGTSTLPLVMHPGSGGGGWPCAAAGQRGFFAGAPRNHPSAREKKLSGVGCRREKKQHTVFLPLEKMMVQKKTLSNVSPPNLPAPCRTHVGGGFVVSFTDPSHLRPWAPGTRQACSAALQACPVFRA